MSLLDPDQQADVEPPPPYRWLTVIGCVVVAVAYSLATVEKLGAWVAGAMGGVLALLLLPTVAALLSARATNQWHRIFAWCFAIIFALVFFGRMLR